MAIGIHVVRVGYFSVDVNGNKIDKNSATITINQLKNTRHEHLVIPDSAIASSANNPTVKQYLESEAALNYVLFHIDQSTIITYDQSDINAV